MQAAFGCCIPILVPKMVLTLCNLHWWCVSFHQPAKILHLQSWSSSPAATCAGGGFPWSTSAFINVRTNELALCGGGGCGVFYVVVVISCGDGFMSAILAMISENMEQTFHKLK